MDPGTRHGDGMGNFFREVSRLYPEARVSNVTLKGVQYHRARLGTTDARDLATRPAALRAAGFATGRVRD